MKILVVYYSRTGHTRGLAAEIARRCDAELREIRAARSFGGFVGYWRAGHQAMKRIAAEILPMDLDPADYDLVVVGTPVWVGRLASPVRAFIAQSSARFKQVAFFCTEGGSGDRKTFDEMARLCGRAPRATLVLRESELPKMEDSAALHAFVEALSG